MVSEVPFSSESLWSELGRPKFQQREFLGVWLFIHTFIPSFVPVLTNSFLPSIHPSVHHLVTKPLLGTDAVLRTQRIQMRSLSM